MAARTALYNVMERAARKAARSLVHDFGEVEHLQVSMKGPGDFVSTADHQAERIIKTELGKASQQELSDALETMRLHDLPSTRLVYQVLRSITCMAFFTQSENWSLTGYPGPVQI